MAEAFAEREKKAPALLPTIRREQSELHSSIDALSRAAAHLRTPPDGTYHNVQEAGLMVRILANVQAFIVEGSVPLHTRFARMLESI